MDSSRNPDTTRDTKDDLSALAWVQDELRRSLDAAHKALRRFVKESEALRGSDVDVVDPSVLRTARAQIHQGVGALELVGLPAAATVLRACEAAVQRYVAKPHKLSVKVVEHIEQASFALLDYLGRMLSGKGVSPLAMFPQYRAVQEDAGADRTHPADLWSVDWRWLELPTVGTVAGRQADDATRGAMEQQLLALMRGPSPAAATRMSELFAALGEGAHDVHSSTLWKLASALFEAQAQGLLGADVFVKRVAARLLAQLRIVERGEFDVSERLAQDLLFFCAQARSPGDGRHAPRLASVRQAYGLAHHVPVDYSVSVLGKFDPAQVAQARKRVAAAKESWSAVAGAEMHRMGGLAEQFALVGDSLKRLFPQGEWLSNELANAASMTQSSASPPSAPLAMEVATGLLYVEASLEDGEFDTPEQGERIRRLADRIAAIRKGAAPEPLEGWMEDLYRRVSDRQTMGSVVQELRASLSEAEKQIDQFFRNPAERDVLVSVPHQMAAMRGVLSVLGMDQAAAALARMRDEVDGLVNTEVDPERVEQTGLFNRLAGNLGALGFLIDMLNVQPQLAKSLFVYDADAGTLSPLMGRSEAHAASAHTAHASPQVEPRLIEQAQLLAMSAARGDVSLEEVTRDLERLARNAQAADQSALAATVSHAQAAIERALGDATHIASARDQLSEALVDFVHTASGPMGLDEAPAPAPAPPTAAAAASAEDLSEDDEMREIFLEEAREVVQNAEVACADLSRSPGDLAQLTTVRRAYHTLKGSSRMVGLKAFGDAAWACEQLYNARLAGQQSADDALIDFTRWSLGELGHWVEDIAARRDAGRDPAVIEAAALGLREPGVAARFVPPATATPALPQEAAPPQATPAELAQPEVRVAESAVLDLPAVPDVPDVVEQPLADLELLASAPVDAQAETIEPAFEDLPELPQVVEASAPAETFEPLSLRLPPDLPSAQDLDLRPADAAQPAAAPETSEIAFELDLGSFDDALPAEPAPALSDSLGVDSAALSLSEPFDFAEQAEPVDVGGQAEPLAGDAGETLSPQEPDFAAAAVDEHAQPWIESLSPSADVSVPPATEIEAVEEGLREEVAEEAVRDTAQPMADAASASAGEDDQTKVVGPLRIGIPLFNIFLNEADELSRRLTTELAEWAMELHRSVGETAIALAHSLAGSSATVGFADLSHLARMLEHSLMRTEAIGRGTPEEATLFVDTAEEIRRLLHQFAAGFLKEPKAELLQRLAEHEVTSARRLDAYAAEAEFEAQRALAAQSEIAEPEAPLAQMPELPAEREADHAQLSEPAEAGFAAEAMGAAEAAEAAEETEAAEATESAESAPAAEAAPVEIQAFEPENIEPLVAVPQEPAFEVSQPMQPAEAGETLDSRFDILGRAELKPLAALPSAGAPRAAPTRPVHDIDDDIDAVDAVDADLFPIFEEEAQELLPKLQSQLRDWARRPSETAHASACMRTLHTLKGGARLAGAMRLGEMAHRLESAIEQLMASEAPSADGVELLLDRSDALMHTFEALRSRDAAAYEQAVASTEFEASQLDSHDLEPAVPTAVPEAASSAQAEVRVDTESQAPETEEPVAPVTTEETVASAPETQPAVAAAPEAAPAAPATPAAPVPEIDWSRFTSSGPAPRQVAADRASAAQSAVRVRAPLLDRLVNQAGEVSITRSRIEVEVNQIKGSLTDLTDNLERLRQQLRDIELQAETQMSSRLEAAKAASQSFDPLEFDRFTRFQELTRMMAESVNDVATVQRTLQRTLESTEDELAAQARLTRDLQDDLLRTRMVEFEGLSDRLYRVVRQAAKETGKLVRLDIVGGSIEVDRGVLDRMTGAFEHLLRNAVTHGLELPQARAEAGKEPTGTVIVSLTQEGNEVGVEFRDDGAGLDLARIRDKAVATGLIDPHQPHGEAELANLIFTPGFTTAEHVTELAGRGVGMDVVRAEVNAMGGRIETATAAGQGTSFKLVLPLTTAVTQVVMLRVGDTTVAVPSTLIEIVRRAKPDEIDAAYQSGQFVVGDRSLPFFWLGSLLQLSPASVETAGRMRQVVIVRSAQQRIAVHVDEVLGNHEVVVKNLGPQLSRVPGLAGMTLLASGAVALIYNPVALATLYGAQARAATVASLQAPQSSELRPVEAEAVRPAAPLVLVVDDSLTVRRVTQRLLVREGYRVALAKDGLDALERLAEEKPSMVLSDIEMPRMDGFDLVRNIRSDARLRDLPVIMITSRIAQKHRDYAAELGVDHYLGKPYSEEDLLALIGRYTAHAAMA